jgi:ATP-binding cassette subfamily B protein
MRNPEASDRPGRPVAGVQKARKRDAPGGERPPRRDLRPLGRIFPFVRTHWGDAAGSLVFLVFSTSATLGLSGAARQVVDKGFSSASAAGLNETFVLLILVAVILAVATSLRFYFTTRLGERVVADLRIALYRHVLNLDQAQFLETRTGEVLSRMTTDMTIIESMVGGSVSIALRNILTLAGALAVLVYVSPRLTFYVALLGPVVIAPLFVFGRRVRKLSVDAQQRFADAIGYAGETLDALDTLQAFGRETFASARFSRAVEGAFSASLARVQARSLMTALVIVLVFSGVATVFWLGAHAVVSGTMTAGALLQFAILAVLAAGSVGALGEVWGDLQKASGAMQRIAELLDAKPAIIKPAAPRPLPTPARGELTFANVVFAYPGRPDLPALNGFDLAVRPGERVAIVGPSGAGKSTVFRVLLRFYDPLSGVVCVDGVDIRDADPSEVRARMAWVSQDAPLFSGSALENLAFGRADATREELLAAAQAAEAEGFLSALPQGVDTPLGERGKTLSGGQRQRLAIARALVRKAPILLLDEATSALDAENERLVQRALHDAMSGCTTLVIAHRLATVLKADRIVVMDGGRVVEMGTHAELSARGGLYARLAELQFGLAAA